MHKIPLQILHEDHFPPRKSGSSYLEWRVSLSLGKNISCTQDGECFYENHREQLQEYFIWMTV